MAEGEKWTDQDVATSFDSGDIISIVQDGVNKQLDYDAFKNSLIQIYSTGWVSNSDWTNAELTVTHNLSTNLSDLIVKFFISTDGTEANAFEIHPTTNNSVGPFGFTLFQTNTNTFYVQTATAGILYISDSGAQVGISVEAWYYKVKVYKLL